MRPTEQDEDEQFYRDTETIAFPKIDDRQLALLEPLGARKKSGRGEMVFKAGQRDLGLTDHSGLTSRTLRRDMLPHVHFAQIAAV